MKTSWLLVGLFLPLSLWANTQASQFWKMHLQNTNIASVISLGPKDYLEQTLILIPKKIDHTKKINLSYYFHGDGWNNFITAPRKYNFIQSLKSRLSIFSQSIVIIPIVSYQNRSRWFSSMHSFEELQLEIMKELKLKQQLELDEISINFNFHSAGYLALKNLLKQTLPEIEYINIIDASYGGILKQLDQWPLQDKSTKVNIWATSYNFCRWSYSELAWMLRQGHPQVTTYFVSQLYSITNSWLVHNYLPSLVFKYLGDPKVIPAQTLINRLPNCSL